jgi:sulfur-oxidizing protein SoxA
MLRRCGRWAVVLAIAMHAASAGAQSRTIPGSQLRSGEIFLSADLRALQDDDLANPGMLWVDRGAELWSRAAGKSGKSCAGCHGEASRSMRGVAARYPAIDPASGELLNLEHRINRCRVEQQGAAALAYESDELLGLSTFIAHQSRGMIGSVKIEGTARAHFDAGREFYYRRHGQLNLACASCHEMNWGKRLGPETVSQGHSNGFPAYRMEWQTLGSLHRRLRACLFAIRAELPDYGSRTLVDLELFLGWRAQGLPLEAPAVRR